MRSSPKRYPNGQIWWHSKWDQNLQFKPQRVTTRIPVNFNGNPPTLDWEQSLFFKWEQCTRAGAAKPRDARNEGGSVPLSSRAISHISSLSSRPISHVAVCVSRVLLEGLQKKERLLVLYPTAPDHASKFKGANSITCSLRASPPIWASKASLARGRLTRPNSKACSQARSRAMGCPMMS